MAETVTVTGLKELREALLRTVPQNMQGKVLQKALAPAANIVLRDARQLAPKDSGRLSRAIFAMRSKRNSNGVFEERIVKVRWGKKQQKQNRDAYYWRWVEFGTKFIQAQPFMRPAFERNRSRLIPVIRESLAESLKKAARAAAWQTRFR
jgi:HK97 gp10 family phage protein